MQRGRSLFKSDWKYKSWKTYLLGTGNMFSSQQTSLFCLVLFFKSIWMLSAVNNSPERGTHQWLTVFSEQEGVLSLCFFAFCSCTQVLDSYTSVFSETFSSSCCWRLASYIYLLSLVIHPFIKCHILAPQFRHHILSSRKTQAHGFNI